MEEKTQKPFFLQALIYGAILGVVSIFISLVFYFLGMTTVSWTQWITFAISLAVTVYLMLMYRNDVLGGYVSFGKMFSMILVASVIATVIGSIYTYLLYTVIDPDLIEASRNAAWEKIYSNARIPENMYDMIGERIEKNLQPTRMVITGLIAGTVINAIIGLILAAILKKEDDSLNV